MCPCKDGKRFNLLSSLILPLPHVRQLIVTGLISDLIALPPKGLLFFRLIATSSSFLFIQRREGERLGEVRVKVAAVFKCNVVYMYVYSSDIS